MTDAENLAPPPARSDTLYQLRYDFEVLFV
jgi:hypothetical protein